MVRKIVVARIVYCILSWCIVSNTIWCRDMRTLTTWATHYPEFPATANNTITNPDYTAYYYQQNPYLITRALRTIGILTTPYFSPEHLQTMLEKAVNAREQEQLQHKSIRTIVYKEPTRLYVWGQLHGSLHSLIRTLTWLHEQGIIDEQLHITDPHTFFIFNGDVIDNAAYCMETLIVIITLMTHNPHQCLYVRGAQETNNCWHNEELRRQLNIRTRYMRNGMTPIATLLDRFFATLPNVIYCTHTAHPTDVLMINYDGINQLTDPIIDASYVHNSGSGIHFHAQVKKQSTDAALNIVAVIHAENYTKQLLATTGLAMLAQMYGSTAWSVCSAPTMFNRTYHHFHYDACTLIDLHDPITHSTITLINNDRETNPIANNFTPAATYNILTGRDASNTNAFAQGFITIGSTMSLIQGIPIVGQRIKQGIDIAINDQNKRGGIGGQHIRLDIRNDDYVPYKAHQNITQFLHDGTTILLAPLSDATLASYEDHIQNNDLAVMFPVAGNPVWHQEKYKGIVHLSATYADGVSAMIDHIIQEHDTSRFAFFFQDDDYGQGPLSAALKKLSEHSITTATKLPYLRGTIKFDAQTMALKSSSCDAIGFFSTSQATSEFLRQVPIENLTNKKLFGTFLLGDAIFKNFIEHKGFSIMLGARVVNPYLSTIPIVQEYRERMDAHRYPYDVFSLEGYIATRLLINILLSIEGDITHDTVIAQAEQLNKYNFGWIPLTFNPATRSLAQHIWLQTGDDNDWLQRDLVIK